MRELCFLFESHVRRRERESGRGVDRKRTTFTSVFTSSQKKSLSSLLSLRSQRKARRKLPLYYVLSTDSVSVTRTQSARYTCGFVWKQGSITKQAEKKTSNQEGDQDQHHRPPPPNTHTRTTWRQATNIGRIVRVSDMYRHSSCESSYMYCCRITAYLWYIGGCVLALCNTTMIHS